MTSGRYRTLGIPMQKRSARRKLVMAAYAVLLLLCGSTFVMHLLYGSNALLPFSVVINGSIVVGIFLFGGLRGFGGRWGLIKPFANRPPCPEPPMVTLVRLQLSPESLLQANESDWRNDEREIARRDRAHDQAFQAVGIGVMLTLLLAFCAFDPRQQLISEKVLRNVLVLVALMTSVLVLTLPSAIILWNEPDMDAG